MKKITLENITGQPFDVEIIDGKKRKSFHFKPHGEVEMEEKDGLKVVKAFPNIHVKKSKK